MDINQDPLGRQASRVLQLNNLEIWKKELEDGSVAVGLFNRGLFNEKIVMKWSDLGLEGKQMLRDVWKQENIGVFDQRFETSLPSHGVRLLKVSRK
ncbi:MAG: hypothetical protein IPH84_11335 [Bacteroidales bacterium]|nr:hypothetical protein [Bacteroidales bacterium]